MAIAILAYDIPGSSYTGVTSGNYKLERAVRRFLINGGDVTDKTTIITDFIAAIDDSDGSDLHPQSQYSTSSGGTDYPASLPLQTVTIQKVGRRHNSDAGLLYIAEATYFYSL